MTETKAIYGVCGEYLPPETRYCPLMLIACAKMGGIGICERERCAWWDTQASRCAMLTIARACEKNKAPVFAH